MCNVWFAADEDLNIYWFSAVNRRHSEELLTDNRVAGTICLPQTPEDPPRGVQFEGTAEMLTDDADVKKAMSHYVGRIFSQEKVDEFIDHPGKPHRFYRVKPSLYVLFDAVNFPDNSRQELVL